MELVTKTQFAVMVKRDPAFVSRAISSGRIFGEALEGVGRSARIRTAVAMEQLGRSLDLSQQLAQAEPILPPAPAPAGRGAAAGVHALREESLELKNRRSRLELERFERDQLRANAELVPAADVAAALRRQLQPLIATFDEVPALVAKAVSEQHGVAYTEALITVKAAIRQQRAAWAERARAMGALAGAEAADTAARVEA